MMHNIKTSVMPQTPAPVQRQTTALSQDGNAIAASSWAKGIASALPGNAGKIASAVGNAVDLPFANDSAE